MLPAEGRARGGDFLVAQRRSVRVVRVRFRRRSLRDDGLAADERGFVCRCSGDLDRAVDRFAVVAVDVANHAPAIAFEALRRVVREPAVDAPVDGNAVVVIERNQFAETQRTRKRTHFVRDAFHHATVAEEHVGAVIDDDVTASIEFGGEQPLRKRHADRVRDPLPQRTGRRFHAGRHVVFRMPRRFRVQLPETSQLLTSAARSRSGAATRTAASSRGRSRARNGPDRTSADSPGCGAGDAARGPQRSRPCPSACPDDRSSPAARRPSPARAAH